MEEIILSIDEAAEFLKLKKSTIYAKKSKNEIPFHKIGGKIVFMKSELIQWIKNQ